MQGIFIAVTGVFIAMNARAEIMASYIGEQLDGVKVRDLTWFGIAHAGSDMDADSMIDQRQRLGQAGAVALDANGDGKLGVDDLKLGAKNAIGFDISAACSGFLYALQTARHTHGDHPCGQRHEGGLSANDF